MNFQHLKSYSFNKKVLKPQSLRGMSGFTLLEMAMVLAIIGLIMVTILSMTKTLSSSSKISATQSKEALIKAALINFIATNNRLPCPADPTATTSTAGTLSTPAGTFGTETVTAATPKGCAMPLNTNVYAGVVPWVTLGLTQDAATDGYNQYFTYLVASTGIQTVSASLVNSGIPSISGLKGAISIYASSTTLTAPTNNCTPTGSTATYNPCSVVVALISHGADGYGAYTNGGPAPAFAFADENQNALHTNQIVMHDFAMNATNPFDDIILSMTASDLLSPLSANGTIQPYNALLNNDFAIITSSITNYVLSSRTGCGGTCTFNFPSTASMTPLSPLGTATVPMPSSVINDPWGTLIVYTRSVASISATTVPSTYPYTATVFTLQSNGPDGVSGTSDDITSSVTVSQFTTPFQNYW